MFIYTIVANIPMNGNIFENIVGNGSCKNFKEMNIEITEKLKEVIFANGTQTYSKFCKIMNCDKPFCVFTIVTDASGKPYAPEGEYYYNYSQL